MTPRRKEDASTDQFRTDRGTCYTNDLLMWQENGILIISPKFQRRKVWKTPARSLFIDTILRDMTVPALYFRLTQSAGKTKTVRELVDGQQRVRSVLEFIADGYRLSASLNTPWAGKKFSQLSPTEQNSITTFAFPAETFQGISDKNILEVFCRLNMNGVGLNRQELRNGRFFGRFKQTAYSLAYDYLEFWRKHKLFTEIGIARMLEVELTSELLIAGTQGMQDKKKAIDEFYSDWDTNYPTESEDKKRFRGVMETLSETFTEDRLSSSSFSRTPLFYTLYCVVYHRLYGLPGVQQLSPMKKLTESERAGVFEATEALSDMIARSKDPLAETPKKYKSFVLACERQTDNVLPRKTRFSSLYGEAF